MHSSPTPSLPYQRQAHCLQLFPMDMIKRDLEVTFLTRQLGIVTRRVPTSETAHPR